MYRPMGAVDGDNEISATEEFRRRTNNQDNA